MAVFAYSGTNADGTNASGFIAADTPKSARQVLAASGIVAETLTVPNLAKTATFSWRAAFYENLGMLVEGGFPVSDALKFMAEDDTGNSRGAVLVVREAILSGRSMLDAMLALAPALPPFERAALGVAELSGTQGKMLLSLAQFMDADRRLRDNVRSAMAYPAMIFGFALLLLATVSFVILPRAAAFFPVATMPPALRLMRIAAPAFAGAALLATFAVVRFSAALRRGGSNAISRERLLLSLPAVRGIAVRLWASRYASTMSLLLDAGLSPQASLLPAGESTGSATIAALAATSEKAVRSGESLFKAVSGIKPIAPFIASWVAIGEKSGSLARMLDSAAARARNDYERRLKRLLSLLEPLLVAAVGIVVLAVALAVLGPMLDLATGGM